VTECTRRATYEIHVCEKMVYTFIDPPGPALKNHTFIVSCSVSPETPVVSSSNIDVLGHRVNTAFVVPSRPKRKHFRPSQVHTSKGWAFLWRRSARVMRQEPNRERSSARVALERRGSRHATGAASTSNPTSMLHREVYLYINHI
jgi:hypothetical protein